MRGEPHEVHVAHDVVVGEGLAVVVACVDHGREQVAAVPVSFRRDLRPDPTGHVVVTVATTPPQRPWQVQPEGLSDRARLCVEAGQQLLAAPLVEIRTQKDVCRHAHGQVLHPAVDRRGPLRRPGVAKVGGDAAVHPCEVAGQANPLKCRLHDAAMVEVFVEAQQHEPSVEELSDEFLPALV